MTTVTDPGRRSMTGRWSRELLLAQLTAERYGDLEQLALERHDRTYVHAGGLTGRTCFERPEVLAGRRFLLMRGLADAHPPAGTWRRPHGPVRAHEEGAA